MVAPARRPPCRATARRRPSCPRAWRPPRGTRRRARSARGAAGWSSRPKLRAASAPAVVTMFQPARPPLTWSSEAKRRARLNGSLYVVEAVAISPIRLGRRRRARSAARSARALPGGRRPMSPHSTGQSARKTRVELAALGDLREVLVVARRRGGANGSLSGSRHDASWWPGAHQERVEVQVPWWSWVMRLPVSRARRRAGRGGDSGGVRPGRRAARGGGAEVAGRRVAVVGELDPVVRGRSGPRRARAPGRPARSPRRRRG